MSFEHDWLVLLSWVALGFHLLGIVSAVRAVMTARSSQGAIAWAIPLIVFPYVTLPFYWIFGRDRFFGYTLARQSLDKRIGELRAKAAANAPQLPEEDLAFSQTLEHLSGMRFTGGNAAKLLVDGQATFDAIFEAIDHAKQYLLVQFFIVRDDELGRALKDKLIAAANRGVRVYFLYDEVGSHALPRVYAESLRLHGIEIYPFLTTKGAKNRFQLNFRNHRKIVVADGKIAFIGGHNVGVEYLGQSKKLGAWRDTHVQIEGPAVNQVQVSFAEDWHWSTGAVPLLNWEFGMAESPGKACLIIPSGPADSQDTCSLFFIAAINAAKRRVWITSPYFVPDAPIGAALRLAALRGVDVRIVIPEKPDHLLVWLSSFSYLRETMASHIKVFRYQAGFLHQKVLLVDDEIASVGTANFDNRSFRLNFEVTALFIDATFGKSVERMLLADLARSRPATVDEITKRPFYFKVAVRVAHLMAPVL